MQTQTITLEGRTYHVASHAARVTNIGERTLRYHTDKGLPCVRLAGHRWYNPDDVREYFAGIGKDPQNYMRARIDTVEFDGRVYHPLVWYAKKYGITRYQLTKLPHKLLGQVCMIAVEDFAEVYWYKEEIRCL